MARSEKSLCDLVLSFYLAGSRNQAPGVRLDSGGLTRWSFEDIILISAAYRPGLAEHPLVNAFCMPLSIFLNTGKQVLLGE